jgi:predicted secreted hydrolase
VKLLLALLLAAAFDAVTPGTPIAFPRDAGAHPGHRIEWWYVTGHLESPRGPLGFQVTFFRVRNPAGEALGGRFSPGQLLFAHAALADPAAGRLLHDQRSARMLQGLVEASVADTGLGLDGWTLRREANGYRTRIDGAEFSLDLVLLPTQPVLLQGERGFSRKGPSATNASEYYSEPQLRVTGRVSAKGRSEAVTGIAWLDHEWSSELLDPDAMGWDWLGANLDDGSALMAFRMRAKDGRTLWAAGTFRPKDGPAVPIDAAHISFTALRTWKSPRSGVAYPVSMQVRIGDRSWRLDPLFDDQELDARASTGTLYWEGAVLLGSGNAPAGRGYLELTGYAGRLAF